MSKRIEAQDVISAATANPDMNQGQLAKVIGVRQTALCLYLGRNPHIKEIIKDIKTRHMLKAGITRDKVYQRLSDGLDANKVISCNIIAPNGESMADAHGATKDFIEVPDFKERRESVKMCLELFGDLKTEDAQQQQAPAIILIRPAGKGEVSIGTIETVDAEST